MTTTKPFFLIAKIYSRWRKRFVFTKSLFLVWCLALSYSFVEYRVVAVLIDNITEDLKEDNLRKAAVIITLLDGLSSIFVSYTHVFEAYTGRFSVIISCTAAYIMGLMLFWVSILTSEKVSTLVYVAVILLALGDAGHTTLEPFLDYQLKEIVRARSGIEVNQQTHSTEEENDHVVRVTIWWRSARFLGAIMATFLPEEEYWSEELRNAALAMVSAYLLFCFGYIFYVLEEPTGSPLTKICRVFKAAFWKFRLEYPVSLESYYWKNYKQGHTYRGKTDEVLLLPHVPSLWRWLDKAAIIREPGLPNPSPERQEMNGDLCTVKEVREVKRFASLIHLSLTLLPYSMVVAAGSTFFVRQTSNLRETGLLNISALFLLKSIARDLALFFIWLKKFTNIRVTIVRIGVGMVCSVLCCLAACLVEVRRLALVKQKGITNDPKAKISMGYGVLVPQYLLLGLMEALADNGIENLFYEYAPKSIWSFGEPFTELVFGIGKLLTIPCAAFIPGWFERSMNDSHLDRYYLMLAALNFVFVIIYGYYFPKYKENYPEDEELSTTEKQEIIVNSQQASRVEARVTLSNPLRRASSMVPRVG